MRISSSFPKCVRRLKPFEERRHGSLEHGCNIIKLTCAYTVGCPFIFLHLLERNPQLPCKRLLGNAMASPMIPNSRAHMEIYGVR